MSGSEECEPIEPGSIPLPRKIAIIGHTGRMGRMLVNKALDLGIKTGRVDLPFSDDEVRKACEDAEFVILCVPAKNLEEVLKKLVPYIPANAILTDITSVKEKPMRQMEAIWSGKVVGTHPLFGPMHQPGDDLPVALVQGNKAAKDDLRKVARFFTAWGCRVFSCSAARHDKAMARIQNMNFITNLAYFSVLAGQKDLLPFLTPSFERRKKAAAKMLTEDAEMFSGLFEANDYSHEAVRQYRKMLNVAASGDIELLCHKARWWWDKDQ